MGEAKASEAMTGRELGEIEKRAKAATLPPWRLRPTQGRQNIVEPDYTDHAFTGVSFSQDADAEFVARARQDIPNLLQEVRRSHAESSQLRKEVGGLKVLLDDYARAIANRQQEVAGLREKVRELEGALDQALRYWKINANSDVQNDESRIEVAHDPEAKLYQELCALCSSVAK